MLLVGAEWRPRALLRAQLIEAGLDVVATDAWTTARDHLLSAAAPRLVVVDLQGLADPEAALRELAALMPPARVLIIRAAATVAEETIHALGFRTLTRPIRIAEIVEQVRGTLHE